MMGRTFLQKRRDIRSWITRAKEASKGIWQDGPGEIEFLSLAGSIILVYLSLLPHPSIHIFLSWLILPIVIYIGGFFIADILLPTLLNRPPMPTVHSMYRRYAILLGMLYLTILAGLLIVHTPF